MKDVTHILTAIESGDAKAAEELLPAVYGELRKLASNRLAKEAGQSLQATELVHEAYLRLVGDQNRTPVTSTLNDIPTKGYTLINTSTGVTVANQIRVALTIRNLFDKVYSEPFNARSPNNPLVEPGRNFILSLNTGI